VRFPKWTMPVLVVVWTLPGRAGRGQDQSSRLNARDLFYRESADQQTPAPRRSAGSSQAGNAHVHHRPVTRVTASEKQLSTTRLSTAPVEHLGLRYCLLLLDRSTRKLKPVPWNMSFRAGDCIALELEADHSGYLYVLNRGSSGKWQALLPSGEMPDESNVIAARTRVQAPQNYCFKITDPPGDENMFIVLTRNPEDFHLFDKPGRQPDAAPSQPESEPAMIVSSGGLDREVERMRAARLASRDLEIAKMDEPENMSSEANSVYVVHTSGAPAERVITEILIKHE
jgi:Domain of unknown function (DUF4384)